MADTVGATAQAKQGSGTSVWTSIGMLIAALLSAPCFVGIILIPVGLGAVGASSMAMTLDDVRYPLMIVSVVLLGLSQWGLGRAQEFRPTKLIWALTIIAVVLIVGELIVDPPFARHALVPMEEPM